MINMIKDNIKKTNRILPYALWTHMPGVFKNIPGYLQQKLIADWS